MINKIKMGFFKHKIYFIVFIIFFFSTLVIQYIYLNFDHWLYSRQIDKNLSKKQDLNKEYKNLVQKQIKRQNQKIPTVTPIQKRQAKGSQNLKIIFVYPSSINLQTIQPLIDTIKNDRRFSEIIDKFLKREAKKYDADFKLDITFFGPYKMDKITKVGDMGSFWGKDSFATTKIQDDFEKIAAKNYIPIRKNDLIAYLYFDDSYGVENENSDPSRFYEYKKFRSFANDIKGITYINVYDFSSSFTNNLIDIVVHETLHFFSATDKYIEYDAQNEKCKMEDLGDIMCLYALENGSKIMGRIVDKNIVINSKTAKEIGWKY